MPRLPILLQIGVVSALFAASLGVLAYTGFTAVWREGRRVSSKRVLVSASDELARRGSSALRDVPEWPLMSLTEWESLNQTLMTESQSALSKYDGVEGGYFVRQGSRFLGASFPTEPNATKNRHDRSRPPGPPPREYDLIETQVLACLRTRKPNFVVESVPPSVVAIRTAPVLDNGNAIAATWVMTRLVDPLMLDQSTRGYGLAASLALGGIAVALALMIGLAQSLRREAAERSRLQDELRRSERLAALGKLLAGVAHEVRNPLAGIRAITQLWRRGLEFHNDAFDHLIEEVDRLEGIVSRLLHFSRANTQTLEPGDLNQIVAEAARLAQPLADEQHVHIELDLSPELPPIEMAGPALLQVFRNLTSNALQAMPDGGTLRLSTRFDPSRREVSARVTDTGPGLCQATLDHLFEPFFTTRTEGTGLGLAIAREITLAHRGDLHAGNVVHGHGAVFTLTIPAVPQTCGDSMI